jgi:glycosyltransferase involved in cell wall biosynthesis
LNFLIRQPRRAAVRVVALVDSVTHVCSRYRVVAFEPFLTAAGHTLELRPLPASGLARFLLFRELRTADAVILQRKLLPRIQLNWLRHYAKRLIFDFDDAIWLRDSYSQKGSTCRRRFRRFARTVRSVDCVVGGNSFLIEQARTLAPRTEVELIPTSINPLKYEVATHERTKQLRLVWIGSSSTLQGLERFRPILEAIGKAIPDTRLKLICDRFIGLEHLAVEAVPWCEATESKDLASADIGITWIPDDDWSRGKCGLKVLQYQAAGLPVIANPVGVHPEFIRPGETGCLAQTPAEWIESIQQLANPATRNQYGRTARRMVDDHYSIAASARKWIDVFHRLTEPLKRAC